MRTGADAGDWLAALAAGARRVAGFADLVDAANVFPVPDADTGRNLAASLSPLIQAADAPQPVTAESLGRNLLMAARGNSGNILTAFFSGFLPESITGSINGPAPADMAPALKSGCRAARAAVPDPAPGTMLTVMDRMAAFAAAESVSDPAGMLDDLADAVRATREQLPVLAAAGVADAGAVGFFLFWEGFWRGLRPDAVDVTNPALRFGGFLMPRVVPPSPATPEPADLPAPAASGLSVSAQHDLSFSARVCVSTAVAGDLSGQDWRAFGDSPVMRTEGGLTSLHLHTRDPRGLKSALAASGKILRWEEEPLPRKIRIASDAAGSLSRADCDILDIALLSSHILIGNTSRPETETDPADLYKALRRGEKVSTAQAADAERTARYAELLRTADEVLYICAGSAFTGNHAAAERYRRAESVTDRFHPLDSGAASGRLGLSVLVTAAGILARPGMSAGELIRMARHRLNACDELVFIDRLRYLAAGGRISGFQAAAGDFLKMKPVITPHPDGVKKRGMVRNRARQLQFLEERITAFQKLHPHLHLLVQYTDNADWVRHTVCPLLARLCPEDHILARPLSLTSGAHMGPGAWSAAFLPRTGDPLPLPAELSS